MDPPTPGFVAMPDLLAPMLATASTELPPDDDAWGYEFKWDGVRAIVYVDGGRARALSRNNRDITPSYPELSEMAAAIGSRRLILDGELVAFDADGRPSFGELQSRMHVTERNAVRRLVTQKPVTFLIFDLLYDDGESLLSTAYSERRERLDALGLAGDSWHTPPWFAGGGAKVFAASKQQRLEGIVMKRLTSTYSPGARSRDWLKLKNMVMQEVVIVGWKPGEGHREGAIGALLLAIPDDDGNLRYVGNVGTGFTDAMLRDLKADLAPLEVQTSTVEAVPRLQSKNAHWVTPTLVGEVTFSEWTSEGRLRHPSWRGLRPDKSAAEVHRES
jgi:bifunctional non-homologous end joining protein LigD